MKRQERKKYGEEEKLIKNKQKVHERKKPEALRRKEDQDNKGNI